jgi:hypothetical protein
MRVNADRGAAVPQEWFFGMAKVASVRQARVSSESPMLNAFCRVAPSVRLSFLAILRAGVFLRAIVFSPRTCSDVQARLFDPFFIRSSYMNADGCNRKLAEREARRGRTPW